MKYIEFDSSGSLQKDLMHRRIGFVKEITDIELRKRVGKCEEEKGWPPRKEHL